MAPGARSKFGASMFEPELFRKQMYCIDESTCDVLGTFRSPSRDGARVILAPPSLRPWDHYSSRGTATHVWKEWNVYLLVVDIPERGKSGRIRSGWYFDDFSRKEMSSLRVSSNSIGPSAINTWSAARIGKNHVQMMLQWNVWIK